MASVLTLDLLNPALGEFLLSSIVQNAGRDPTLLQIFCSDSRMGVGGGWGACRGWGWKEQNGLRFWERTNLLGLFCPLAQPRKVGKLKSPSLGLNLNLSPPLLLVWTLVFWKTYNGSLKGAFHPTQTAQKREKLSPPLFFSLVFVPVLLLLLFQRYTNTHKQVKHLCFSSFASDIHLFFQWFSVWTLLFKVRSELSSIQN